METPAKTGDLDSEKYMDLLRQVELFETTERNKRLQQSRKNDENAKKMRPGLLARVIDIEEDQELLEVLEKTWKTLFSFRNPTEVHIIDILNSILPDCCTFS